MSIEYYQELLYLIILFDKSITGFYLLHYHLKCNLGQGLILCFLKVANTFSKETYLITQDRVIRIGIDLIPEAFENLRAKIGESLFKAIFEKEQTRISLTLQ